MTRSGSYPLMNLAKDFGVDYGDLLLWADNRFYEWKTFHTPSHNRYQEAYAASTRMRQAIGTVRLAELEVHLHRLTDRRATWCRPPQGGQTYA